MSVSKPELCLSLLSSFFSLPLSLGEQEPQFQPPRISSFALHPPGEKLIQFSLHTFLDQM